MNNYLEKLVKRESLTSKEAATVVEMILTHRLTPIHVAGLLSALCTKGESVDEISGFIRGSKKHMVSVQMSDAIDVCGTGGDGLKTFNISTAVAFVIAGAGVSVAKHGNRGVSSKCGSADVLEALGVNIQLSPNHAEKVFEKVGMVFLFAPLFHPAFKYAAQVRKELGIRTIFNYLGPFLNPAQTKRQLIGVPTEEMAKKLIEVSKKLSYRHLFIVVSKDGMDEVSTTTTTTVFENNNGNISQFLIDPKEYGLQNSSNNSLTGGNALENAQIIIKILEGGKGTQRNIVVLNSALALMVAGKVKAIQEGIDLAEESIDSGEAKKILKNLKKETQRYA